MRKRIGIGAIGLLFVLAMATAVSAYDYPSTNADNRDGTNLIRPGVVGPHVLLVDKTMEDVTLEFVNPHSYAACFEYRTDGDTSQAISEDHPNPFLDDALYPHECVTDGTVQMTIEADSYVEVRLAFGAERDWDFDWTQFDLVPTPTKAEVLAERGVPGKGLASAPGLMKERPNANFANGQS